ncbi:MAG: hypothetical protein AAB036_01155 [Elusimicrobiota bacterium]
MEALRAGAQTAFVQPAFERLARHVTRVSDGEAKANGSISDAIILDKVFSKQAVTPLEESVQTESVEVAALDLPLLLNRQQQTSLKYALGGTDVWISAAFDRAQRAYVSILVSGSEARFFNIKSLLTQERQIPIGANTYALSLSAKPLSPLKSEIILENIANEEDRVAPSIKKILGAVLPMGDEVKVNDQTYRVFYIDDINDGLVDKSAKTMVFILTDEGGSIHVFLMPAELAVEDKMVVFSMFRNQRVGILRQGDVLRIFKIS